MCCITFCSTMYLHTRYLSTLNIPAKFQAVDFETWKKPPESAYFLLLCKFPPLSVVGKWNIPQWDGQIFSGSAIFRESIDWIMLTCNEHSMSYWSNAQATKDSSWHLDIRRGLLLVGVITLYEIPSDMQDIDNAETARQCIPWKRKTHISHIMKIKQVGEHQWLWQSMRRIQNIQRLFV